MTRHFDPQALEAVFVPHASNNDLGALPCVVFDSNVVLALWWFEDPHLAALLDMVTQHRIRLVSSPQLLAELQHVMDRRMALAPEDEALQSRRRQVNSAVSRWFSLGPDPLARPPTWPRCTDSDDQKFIDFALGLPANVLLTRDKAVLKVRKRASALGLRVMTPEAFTALPAGHFLQA